MEQIIKELQELKNLMQEQQIHHKEILSLKEAAKYLGISKSTLYKMTFDNRISHYKPSGKLIYFKKQDLEQYLLKYKVKSNDELEADIESKLL
ncbi:helix-turn-helix domain-containing protein [Aquimarina agarivorans]|uniref:helix-turn-helix domain-containing protein n=1 Tax=Aquimarina agarivorans TaxID=980584 RepID=UPI000248F87D|nr:helix-turn-helix domain-containing protein [Aquimarina agarivorans]